MSRFGLFPRVIRDAVLGVFAIMGVCIWQAAAVAAPPPPGYSLAPMLDKVLPAVVNISTQSKIRVERNTLLDDPFFRRFFRLPEQEPQQRKSRSLGSGVIVDARNGYVVTNHHVIDNADEITVTLRDRRKLKARLVGTDPEADIALLQIGASDLTAIPVADSDKLRVGDFVVAIGNPFGLSQTVTYGIVSALGRSDLGIEGYEDFIQTDASINPGNSGGALVSTSGELVGINTAIVGPSGGNIGIGFAIPSNMAKSIVVQLAEHGAVERGQLGVLIQDLTPELASAFELEGRSGVVVSGVVPGSPAEKNGLRPGDIIVSINGRPIVDTGELRNAVGLMRVGSAVILEVMRDGQVSTIETIIADNETSKADAGMASEHLAGAVLREMETSHPLAGRVQGVEIASVERGSPAWAAGLRSGDIVVAVNREPVVTVEEMADALDNTRDGLLLHVQRGEGTLFVFLR